jgi:hypothetical protein
MVTVRDVLKAVSSKTGHSVEDLIKSRNLVLYRQVVCYLSKRAGRSSVHISRVLRKDHKTVLYSIRRIVRKIIIDAQLRQLVDSLERLIWTNANARHARSALIGTVMVPTDVSSARSVFTALTVVRSINPQT